jgi:hypothetical protein
LDPWSGNTSDPQSLHKYAYAHCDPVNGIDPSGSFTLSDVYYAISAIIMVAAYYLGPVVAAASVAAGTVGLIQFIANPDFRAEMVSVSGGPNAAMNIVAAEISFGRQVFRQSVNEAPKVINEVKLRFNTGDLRRWKIKTGRLQRAAENGDLIVVQAADDLRLAGGNEAQRAYRAAVKKRYVKWLQQGGMSADEAKEFAELKFQSLHVDHRLDLQVSGALEDPNAFSNLGMEDASVNTSVGKQLELEIKRLGLQNGDSIDRIVLEGVPKE